MTYARCFNCNVGLPVCGRSMEELLNLPLPVFCCTNCSLEFPNNGTKEFIEKIESLKNKMK